MRTKDTQEVRKFYRTVSSERKIPPPIRVGQGDVISVTRRSRVIRLTTNM